MEDKTTKFDQALDKYISLGLVEVINSPQHDFITGQFDIKRVIMLTKPLRDIIGTDEKLDFDDNINNFVMRNKRDIINKLLS